MTNEIITINEYWYLMNRIAYWLVNTGQKFTMRDVYGYFNRSADRGTVLKAIKERGTQYQSDSLIAEFVECAIHDNNDLSFLPTYVTGSNGNRYNKSTYVSMANRVSAYEVLNNKSPVNVYLEKNSENTVNTDKVLNAFEKAFGTVTTVDEALTKIKGRKYSYYYNSQYNTQTTINRIQNKQGVNCTDSAQLIYRVALALGYKVQFIHVKCSSGTGHIRLRLKHPTHTGNSWIYRDPASVLSGNSITSNWCSNGSVIAYDPSWIFSDLYQ